tara:strand:- start:698 stop:901 length:204 start_codon:yes stop_codon:yes gene_type:complete
MNKRNNHLKVLVLEYVQSVLEMASNIDAKNINQVISLIKANIRVLENDVKNSFSKHETQSFHYKDIN